MEDTLKSIVYTSTATPPRC